MGKRGRVIEAYFDGQQLILRSTGLYHFRDQTSLAFQGFRRVVRWRPGRKYVLALISFFRYWSVKVSMA